MRPYVPADVSSGGAGQSHSGFGLGLVVAVLLVVGLLPLLVGLAIVVPVLGRATWHLYRRLVAPADRGIVPDRPI